MRLFLSTIACAGLLLSSSCASIVSHSRWPVAVSSAPAGATVTITNRKGVSVYTGTTPATVSLESGSAFFKREIYKLEFTMPGYAPKTTTLEADVNGWYFGNIVFGGVIGLLIVDPATGAMYRLASSNVSVAMSKLEAFNLPATTPGGLRIVSIDQVPMELRAQLVSLK